MVKKILIGIIVALVVFGIALGIYLFSSNSKGEGGFSLGSFFPFGNSQEIDGNGTENTGNGEENEPNSSGESTPAPKIRKISNDQVAGSTLINTAKATIIRYVERGTGHIYETDSQTLSQKKISNTTIPKIYDTLWLQNGDSLLLRYLKGDNETIETFYAKLGKSNASTEGNTVRELEGVFLKTDIKEVVASPNKTSIFSLLYGVNGSTGIVSLPDGTKTSKTTALPIKELLVAWPKDTTLVLTTKPSAGVPGYAYTLDSRGSELNKLIGGVNGLTVLANPTLSYILYSEARQGRISLYNLNLSSGVLTAAPIQTLPEKCVWSKKGSLVIYCAVPTEITPGEYPDNWYQGSVSFSDKIWKIDLKTNTTTLIADLKEEMSVDIDGTNLLLNEKEDYLTFINKKDSSLWGIQLNTRP